MAVNALYYFRLEGKAMEKAEYKKLDLKKLFESKPSKIVSTKEALKDVEPIQWSEEVLSGKAKVIVSIKQ